MFKLFNKCLSSILNTQLFHIVCKHIALCTLLTVYSSYTHAENLTVNREYQLKTAYIFHFAELAEWPQTLAINICLQGSSALQHYLPILEGQQIDGKTVHVLLDNVNDISNCRILILSELSLLSDALKEQTKRNHILLVSDADGFAMAGGMVQLTMRDNKLKLVINLSAVKQADIKLSSKLLRMAEILE